MIIAQGVISALIHRPGDAPKPLSFQDVSVTENNKTKNVRQKNEEDQAIRHFSVSHFFV